jgi:hypothetical protein
MNEPLKGKILIDRSQAEICNINAEGDPFPKTIFLL